MPATAWILSYLKQSYSLISSVNKTNSQIMLHSTSAAIVALAALRSPQISRSGDQPRAASSFSSTFASFSHLFFFYCCLLFV